MIVKDRPAEPLLKNTNPKLKDKSVTVPHRWTVLLPPHPADQTLEEAASTLLLKPQVGTEPGRQGHQAPQLEAPGLRLREH